MPRRGAVRPWPELGEPPRGLCHQAARYLAYLAEQGRSPETIRGAQDDLRLFLEWCAERSLAQAEDLMPSVLERYQRHLYEWRTRQGQPLAARTQFTRLNVVRELCALMVRTEILGENPAAGLELPRVPKRLPRGMLTLAEVERLLAMPDARSPDGLRDRAMLEVTFATGMRAIELASLDVADFDARRGALVVRAASHRRGREAPLSSRACEWLARYLDEVRPEWAIEHPDERALFIGRLGDRLAVGYLEHRLGRYGRSAGLASGVFRALRDTVAAGMLEAGADARFVQELLGHVCLRSTMKYTRVSIAKLREVHEATHPAEIRHKRARAKET